MSVIDAHVHVWDPRRLPYPWLRGTQVDRPMLPADVDRAAGRTTGMIFVQASEGEAVEEARWVSRSDWPELIGIVAGADLAGGPEAILAHLDELAALGPVVGVRHLLQDMAVSDFPRLREGLRLLADRGGTFDACVRHGQLPALIELIDDVPHLNVILDHLGKPPVDEGIAGRSGRAWERSVAQLAGRPRTFVKVSGLTAESADAAAFGRHADEWIAHAVAAFGPERAMIGSDWPVSATFGIGGTFSAWVDRVRRVVGEHAWPEVSHASALRAYLPSGTPGLGPARGTG